MNDKFVRGARVRAKPMPQESSVAEKEELTLPQIIYVLVDVKHVYYPGLTKENLLAMVSGAYDGYQKALQELQEFKL